MAAGDSQYPISSEVGSLPRMRREALKTIVRNPGISTYDLAKRLKRDYSRVLKDVRFLAEMGEVEVRPDPQSNRKAKRLVPVRSINSALAGIILQ
jgi:predicted transcriptional regulator